jgi:MFS family permease
MHAERNIKLLEAQAILANLMFILPVILPYYRDQMGIGFREMLLGEAAFATVVVLLEVPTGWISDVWQRRHTLALGMVFDMLGFFLMLIGDSLAWAIAAQAVIGVGISLISGTNNAMLYDTLLSANREGEYRRREGKRLGISLYSVAAAGVTGGFLYQVDHRLPLVLTLAVQAMAFIACCLMEEPERHRKAPDKHPVADMIETARYALHGHAEVGFIIVFTASLFCATKMIMWTQQPYYIQLGLPESLFGVLMAAGWALGGIASHCAHLLDGKVSVMKALLGVWALAVLACLGASVAPGWHGVVCLMLGGSCVFGLASPRVSEAINRHVSSERRATVLSTQNLMVSLMFIPLSFAMGKVSDAYGVAAVLRGLALWLCLAGACLGLWAWKKRR